MVVTVRMTPGGAVLGRRVEDAHGLVQKVEGEETAKDGSLFTTENVSSASSIIPWFFRIAFFSAALTPMMTFLFSSTSTYLTPSITVPALVSLSPMNECGIRCMHTSPSKPPVAKAIMVFREAGSSSVGTSARIKLGKLFDVEECVISDQRTRGRVWTGFTKRCRM